MEIDGMHLYILGMSHAVAVLKAVDRDRGVDHQNYSQIGDDNWSLADGTPKWAENPMPDKWKALPFRDLHVFLIRPFMGMEANLAERNNCRELVATSTYLKLLEIMERKSTDSGLVSFINGNEHSVMNLVEVSDPYDFVLPGDKNLPLVRGRQPIESKFVATELVRRMNPTIAMLYVLRQMHPMLRIWHVMPPPPASSETKIKSQPEIFREIMEKRGITPLSVRLKTYWLYCSLLKEHLNRLNIVVIDPPSPALDSYGALKEEFQQGCTHGNEAYGALVASQLHHALL
jgi:hypothetical protein